MADTRTARDPGARRSARRWLGVPASLGASLLLALGVSAPASAHDELRTATPAADSTLTDALSRVELGFSDDLLALGDDMNGFAIEVVDGDDRHYESGCVTVAGPNAATEVASGPAGTYEVTWQVVSGDGHPTSGSYSFAYSPSQPGEQSNHTIAPLCGDAWAGTPVEDDSEPLPTLSADPNAPAETPAPDVPLQTPADGGTPAADGNDTDADADADSTDASDATDSADAEDADAASSDVPLWAIVLGGIAGLGLIAAVIALTLRRSRRFPGEGGPGSGDGDPTP